MHALQSVQGTATIGGIGMRIRQIKPDYWRDSRLHNTRGITADVREFYIGLWGIADDYGWLRLDVPEMASELYRYRSPGRRQRDVAHWLELLAGIGRIHVADCLQHAVIPKLAAHQRIGGTKAQTYLLEHQKCPPPQGSADLRDVPHGSVSVTVGNGKERNGKESNVSDFEDALARAQAKAGKAS